MWLVSPVAAPHLRLDLAVEMPMPRTLFFDCSATLQLAFAFNVLGEPVQ
jgi:hypothetical protein